MNVVLYHSNKHKKINGTLFYAFEYYCLIKESIPDLKYILFNATNDDLKEIKRILLNKYNVPSSYIEDITNKEKYVDILKLNIKNLLILDVHTYERIKDFTLNIDNVKIYSNDSHDFLNLKDNHIFYGWYKYQIFNKKTRLKIYKEIHKTYEKKGNKVYLSSPNSKYGFITKELGLNQDDIITKLPNKTDDDLFEKINKIIYYYAQSDTNNRIIVEAYIHNIEVELHNVFAYDSVQERYDTIKAGNVSELFLTNDDILIKDFIKDCSE